MCVPAGGVGKKQKFPEGVAGLVCPRGRKEAVGWVRESEGRVGRREV